MQPYKIEVYIYAESEQEAREVQPDICIGDADHRNGGYGRSTNSVAVCCG